ncbi:MAG TPA: prephenate dehydrogenase/arogenate dehydrogenase family protein [Burkholderiales bacterium]|nr:prephenate dehydrogenase/arogenate dehydrogenase family protein [Burkholderiales bacterium]
MPARKKIERLVVIGVGLIGGSFALALKKARAVKHVVGVGRTRRNLALARRRGIVDEIATDAGRAVRDADFVFLGTPVGQMADVMARIAPDLAPHAVVTDGGSTKQDVIAYARAHLGPHYGRFVPSHPIAGTEQSGAGAAYADLFRERKVILTPTRETSAGALRAVRSAWRQCGALLIRMAAREHDDVLAAVSHLPHVVAFALMNALAQRADAPQVLRHSGGGLRDTVRIAGSSPEMWRDVCLANRDALLAALDGYTAELTRCRTAIEHGDGAALEAMFERARAARSHWLLRRRVR